MADLQDDLPAPMSASTTAVGELDRSDDVTERARALLAASPVVEGHAALSRLPDIEDLPPARATGVGAQFWSLSVEPCEQPLVETLRRIDEIRTLVAKCPEDLRLARTTAEIADARNCGRVAALLGPVSATALGDSLATIRACHALGVRAATLTRFDRFTHEAVREMNRLGILVDLSGAPPDTVREVLRITKAPVLLTRAEPEELPDDVLRLLGENGAVCMVPMTASPSATADHLDRLRTLAGPQSTGLSHGPPTLEHGYQDLIAELLTRAWPEADIKDLTRANVTRALRTAEFHSRAARLRQAA